MFASNSSIVEEAEAMSRALQYEPAIHPDFIEADVPQIVRIMLGAMTIGVTEPSSLKTYLNKRGSQFRDTSIDFLLNTFEGTDPDRHLWTMLPDGHYAPMFPAIPG